MIRNKYRFSGRGIGKTNRVQRFRSGTMTRPTQSSLCTLLSSKRNSLMMLNHRTGFERPAQHLPLHGTDCSYTQPTSKTKVEKKNPRHLSTATGSTEGSRTICAYSWKMCFLCAPGGAVQTHCRVEKHISGGPTVGCIPPSTMRPSHSYASAQSPVLHALLQNSPLNLHGHIVSQIRFPLMGHVLSEATWTAAATGRQQTPLILICLATGVKRSAILSIFMKPLDMRTRCLLGEVAGERFFTQKASSTSAMECSQGQMCHNFSIVALWTSATRVSFDFFCFAHFAELSTPAMRSKSAKQLHETSGKPCGLPVRHPKSRKSTKRQ